MTTWTVGSSVRADYLHLNDYGGSAASGHDNQPAFADAIAVLIGRGLGREPGTWPSSDTCTLEDGSVTVLDSNAQQWDVGAYVSGTGVPAGATIVAVDEGVSFDMSVEATASRTGSLQIGYPKGVIRAGVGDYEIHSPIPNLGPFVTVLGAGSAQTRFRFKGSGTCFRYWGRELARDATGTLLIDGCTIDGIDAVVSGRIDADCETVADSLTVLDPDCVSDDVGLPVYGMGISEEVTIATVNPGVSFTLSAIAPYDRTGPLQIGGDRNVGLKITACECGTIGEDMKISNFYTAGAAGLGIFADSLPSGVWNEKIHIPRLVLVDNYTQVHAWSSSVAYSTWNFITYGSGYTDTHVLIDCCGLWYCTLRMFGNLFSAVGQQSCVLGVVGHNFGGPGHVRATELDINVELHASGTHTQTINIGSQDNNLINCYGRLKFGYGADDFEPCNVEPQRGKFEFSGLVWGETSILPDGIGLNRMARVGLSEVSKPQIPASESLDMAAGEFFDVTLASDQNVLFANSLPVPARRVIRVKQAASGGPYDVLSWPSAGSPTTSSPTVVWEGGSTPTQSTGAGVADLYILETMDGATWYGRHIAGA